MERQLWRQLSDALADVNRRLQERRRLHPTCSIVRVHLWAALHDRPTCWACQAQHWPRELRPPRLPDQSTLSRRLRHPDTDRFYTKLLGRLRGRGDGGLFKAIDALPLPISRNSRDPDGCRFGGAGGRTKGYKLHALWGDRPVPEAFEVTAIPANECPVAKRLVAQLSPCRNGTAILAGDSQYDGNDLYDQTATTGHRLLTPPRRPGRSVAHYRQSRHRLWARRVMRRRGPMIERLRKRIERRFASLCGFGGGLMALPPWVRRLHRVTLWVTAKLLINAARIRTAARTITA